MTHLNYYIPLFYAGRKLEVETRIISKSSINGIWIDFISVIIPQKNTYFVEVFSMEITYDFFPDTHRFTNFLIYP